MTTGWYPCQFGDRLELLAWVDVGLRVGPQADHQRSERVEAGDGFLNTAPS